MVSVGNDLQWWGQCGFTICYHEAAPYQIHQASDMCGRLPNLTGSCAHDAKPIGGFGLVTPRFTIAYQLSDLGQDRPGNTFTNHYHRTGGEGLI